MLFRSHGDDCRGHAVGVGLVAYRRAQKTHPNLHFRMYQPDTDTGVMLPDAMQKAAVAARQQP